MKKLLIGGLATFVLTLSVWYHFEKTAATVPIFPDSNLNHVAETVPIFPIIAYGNA